MKEPQKKKSEKRWVIAAGIVLILAVLLFLLLFRSCQGKNEKPLPESSGIVYDQSAVRGGCFKDGRGVHGDVDHALLHLLV